MHELPNAARRRRLVPRSLLKVVAVSALCALTTAVLAAPPVVGIHYQDLEPGSTGEIVMVVANPGLTDPTGFAASSDDACLSVGELYNTRFDVWRLPAILLGEETCRATVTVSARTGEGEWSGLLLVTLNPVTDAIPLDSDAGLTLSYGSRTPWLEETGATTPNGFAQHDTTIAEFTFENGAAAPFTVMSLSANPAQLELLSHTFSLRRVNDAVAYQLASPAAWPQLRAARGEGLVSIQPGGAATLALAIGPDDGQGSERMAVTLGLLPIVRLAGEQYYLPGVVATYHFEGPAHGAP